MYDVSNISTKEFEQMMEQKIEATIFRTSPSNNIFHQRERKSSMSLTNSWVYKICVPPFYIFLQSFALQTVLSCKYSEKLWALGRSRTRNLLNHWATIELRWQSKVNYGIIWYNWHLTVNIQVTIFSGNHNSLHSVNIVSCVIVRWYM